MGARADACQIVELRRYALHPGARETLLELFDRERTVDLGRPFMARFGDIARIDGSGRRLRVTLKSGAEAELDRFGADDLADGIRVTDREGRVLELGEWEIESIELLPSPGLAPASYPLHVTLRRSRT